MTYLDTVEAKDGAREKTLLPESRWHLNELGKLRHCSHGFLQYNLVAGSTKAVCKRDCKGEKERKRGGDSSFFV